MSNSYAAWKVWVQFSGWEMVIAKDATRAIKAAWERQLVNPPTGLLGEPKEPISSFAEFLPEVTKVKRAALLSDFEVGRLARELSITNPVQAES